MKSKRIISAVFLFSFLLILISVIEIRVCYAQPSEEIIKQAIAKECYAKKGFSGYNIDIKISKIGDYDSKRKYYPVYADIAFWVPTTIIKMGDIDHFKLYKDKEGNWKADLVEK